MLPSFYQFASSSVILRASQLVSQLVAAALLEPATWGYWYLLNLIVSYGSLFQLGALNGMNREVPFARGVGDKKLAIRLSQSALAIVLRSTSVAAVLLIVAIISLPSIEFTLAVLLTVGLLFMSQLYAYVSVTLKATDQFRDLSRLQWCEAALYPVCTICGALVGGLVGFISGLIVVRVLFCVLALMTGRIAWRPKVFPLDGKHLVGVGFPIMMVGLIHTLLTTVDRWIIGGYLGSQALGQYALAIMMLSAVGFIPNVVSQQFYPRMAYLWAANRDVLELRHLVTQQRRYTFALVVPVVIVAGIIGPLIVRNYLPSFLPGVPAMLLCVTVPLISTIGQGCGAILHVLNRQAWYLGALGIALIINVLLSVMLIAPLGMFGVAIGTFGAYGVLAILRVAFGELALRRVTG